MKRTIFIYLLACVPFYLKAQTPSYFDVNNNWSLAGGYGQHGVTFRFDLKLTELTMTDPFTAGTLRFYLDLGFKPISFAEPRFVFNQRNYSSDARMTTLGAGGGLDAKYGRFSIYPYAGLRAYFARFTDQALIDAISTYGLFRYHTDRYGFEEQVGPAVDNAYGDAFTIDVGTALGFHISRTLEIGGLIGLSPVKFSTSETLYGRYWGEPPYPNRYYMKPSLIRGEVRVRVNF